MGSLPTGVAPIFGFRSETSVSMRLKNKLFGAWRWSAVRGEDGPRTSEPLTGPHLSTLRPPEHLHLPRICWFYNRLSGAEMAQMDEMLLPTDGGVRSQSGL